jgi:hypothetical protein
LVKIASWHLVQEVAASADERETAPTGDVLIDAMAMLDDMRALGTPAPFNSTRQVEPFRQAVSREYLCRDRHSRRDRLRVQGHDMAWVGLPRTPVPLTAPVRPRVPRQEDDMRPFPTPPFPDIGTIRPLTTPKELIQEGNVQQLRRQPGHL